MQAPLEHTGAGAFKQTVLEVGYPLDLADKLAPVSGVQYLRYFSGNHDAPSIVGPRLGTNL